MMRDIVRIDPEKCTGCGACAGACEEGAIQMIGGKAVLVREDHCDGLGACLPSCPADAISIEKRDVPEFSAPSGIPAVLPGIPMQPAHCPGSMPRTIGVGKEDSVSGRLPGRLSQWPVQIRLAPLRAPYFEGCDLLVAADCSAFACGSFHEDFMKGKIVLIGCPKLDPQDSWRRLAEIIASNGIRSVTAVRMEVPCCGPLSDAARSAADACRVPFSSVTLGIDGIPRG